MKFKIEFDIPKKNHEAINYGDTLLSIGSCFSNDIGQKLLNAKFDVISNPLGVLYDPLSIFKILKDCLHNIAPSPILINDLYVSFALHSEIRAVTKDDFNSMCLRKMDLTRDYLKKAKWLIITPGTAYSYRHLTSNELVANCHKITQREFRKELLNTQLILDAFESLYLSIKEINPALQCLFTVSPVRHLKDGLNENTQSKAILHLATHEIVTRFKDCHYFPSYEIMIDELRDYRFYKSDMIHPNELAIDYIWERFLSTYFSEHTLSIYELWGDLSKEMMHKPFNPHSIEHQKFIRKTLKKLADFPKNVNVNNEIEDLKKMLLG